VEGPQEEGGRVSNHALKKRQVSKEGDIRAAADEEGGGEKPLEGGDTPLIK